MRGFPHDSHFCIPYGGTSGLSWSWDGLGNTVGISCAAGLWASELDNHHPGFSSALLFWLIFSSFSCIYFLQLLLSLHHLSPALMVTVCHMADWIQTPSRLGSGSFWLKLDRPWPQCATSQAQRRVSAALHEWPNVSVIRSGKCCWWSCHLGQKRRKWRYCEILI